MGSKVVVNAKIYKTMSSYFLKCLYKMASYNICKVPTIYEIVMDTFFQAHGILLLLGFSYFRKYKIESHSGFSLHLSDHK